MLAPIDFILGLLDAAYPACVAWEDFEGPLGAALRSWQQLGFLAAEPEANPVVSCPYCCAGTPYKLAEVYLCGRCRSEIDGRELWLWRLELETLLYFLASEFSLTGSVSRIDDTLWELGTLRDADRLSQCFYLRGGRLSEHALRRLTTFRSTLLLHGKPCRPVVPGYEGNLVSLAEILVLENERLIMLPLFPKRPRGGAVRFDVGTGVIAAGEVELGRIPLGTREFWFLEYLAAHAGQFLPYEDLKHYVGQKTRTRADTDEATYCQKLRSRLKLHHRIRHIDDLIQSDRKGGGYRLLSTLDAAALWE